MATTSNSSAGLKIGLAAIVILAAGVGLYFAFCPCTDEAGPTVAQAEVSDPGASPTAAAADKAASPTARPARGATESTAAPATGAAPGDPPPPEAPPAPPPPGAQGEAGEADAEAQKEPVDEAALDRALSMPGTPVPAGYLLGLSKKYLATLPAHQPPPVELKLEDVFPPALAARFGLPAGCRVITIGGNPIGAPDALVAPFDAKGRTNWTVEMQFEEPAGGVRVEQLELTAKPGSQ